MKWTSVVGRGGRSIGLVYKMCSGPEQGSKYIRCTSLQVHTDWNGHSNNGRIIMDKTRTYSVRVEIFEFVKSKSSSPFLHTYERICLEYLWMVGNLEYWKLPQRDLLKLSCWVLLHSLLFGIQFAKQQLLYCHWLSVLIYVGAGGEEPHSFDWNYLSPLFFVCRYRERRKFFSVADGSDCKGKWIFFGLSEIGIRWKDELGGFLFRFWKRTTNKQPSRSLRFNNQEGLLKWPCYSLSLIKRLRCEIVK